ncbi:hypothetical protein [Lysinibacillus sp. FJAT-14222]|uniref:hypothetical protein n=1 Tax=Lysinibacillus sp. FJAT-14222 TaxID=1932366 RepID=UPI0006AF7FBA|nr:hypothetical protein [Lysinibacillus sp. FJAT-14222]KOS60285.1 hypothetical protein AN161_24655 [Lysinibacillus sp. FJAT-14222]
MSRLGQQMFFARKRSDSNSMMLVTKALSQDVMVLALVPLSLIPKESLSLHSNQLTNIAKVLTIINPNIFNEKPSKFFKSILFD